MRIKNIIFNILSSFYEICLSVYFVYIYFPLTVIQRFRKSGLGYINKKQKKQFKTIFAAHRNLAAATIIVKKVTL